MRLLKIIGVFFAIYFIRRFIQMYKVMSEIQRQQMAHRPAASEAPPAPRPTKPSDVIEADFKVVDR